MSNSPLTVALGALSCSHALKSLRWADSRARRDFTALLEKSIFCPCAGWVLGDVDSGSPARTTIALPVSTVALLLAPSLCGLAAAMAPVGAAASVAATTAAVAAIVRPVRARADVDTYTPPWNGRMVGVHATEMCGG